MSVRGGGERLGLREVAERAGVSHMTVSRVLNGHPQVKESTRQRVLEVVAELDFRPNSAARELVTQRALRIGVVIESAVEFGPSSILRAIERSARDGGYSVASFALRDDSATPEEAVRHLTGQGIDALCVVAPRSSSVAVLRTITTGLPTLVVKAEKDPAFLTVSVDQAAGTKLAVDHLASLGHRDVLHLSGPLDWFDARARERAFHARTRAWGMHERPIVIGDWSSDFGYDYARGLTGVPEYTAVFVANDEMALGVIHGLHDRGIRVPEDLSVVGFDDLPVSRHFLPPLTTVRQDFPALGSLVVDVLIAAIEGREIPQNSRIPAELVVRDSSAAARPLDRDGHLR
ncbi:LacI family DNA-binding transcriptional regulator [Frigoribacterium sp. SL97]|nr:LacI family DNA-binding transcriptional regulator [Frigoribacterium sp. SL97]